MTENLLMADAGSENLETSPVQSMPQAAIQAPTQTPSTQNVPAKFMNPKTGEINVQALLNSYMALEKKMSQRPQINVPTKPSEYKVSCNHGLFQPDLSLNQKMMENGFSQEQAQLVYDMAAETMVPMILDMAAEFEADREVSKLEEHFGGKEQWEQVSRQILAYGQKNLPASVLQGMASSFEGVQALYRMMQEDQPNMTTNTYDTGMAEEQDIQAMVKDPRYWHEKDPQFIAQVTNSFEKYYGDK